MADKDKFYSVISHDLRGPFGSIRGLIQLMNDQYENYSREEVKEYLSIIRTSSDQTYELLENLLKWSKVHSGSMIFFPTLTNIPMTIDQVLAVHSPMSEAKKIEISKDYDLVGDFVVDVNMLRTVLRNLLTNAIKFTPTQGKIVVSGAIAEGQLVLSVIDSGNGMEADTASRLFTNVGKYSTLGTDGERGTGLGLLIAKEFVQKHKGNIFVESVYGKGSKFTVVLPVLHYPDIQRTTNINYDFSKSDLNSANT